MSTGFLAAERAAAPDETQLRAVRLWGAPPRPQVGAVACRARAFAALPAADILALCVRSGGRLNEKSPRSARATLRPRHTRKFSPSSGELPELRHKWRARFRFAKQLQQGKGIGVRGDERSCI